MIMAANAHGERFFQKMAWVLFALVISGFGLMQLVIPEATGPFTPLIGIHAAILLTWFGLLIVQPTLIAAGKWQLHRKLGFASIAVAIGVVVLGYLTTRGAFARPDWTIARLDQRGSAIFPTMDLIGFSIAYIVALVFRRSPAVHKRFMLLAGILMIDPAAARLVGTLGLPPPVILLVHLGLLAALIVYDVRKLGRPHWASLAGLGIVVAGFGTKFAVPQTDWWAGIAQALYG